MPAAELRITLLRGARVKLKADPEAFPHNLPLSTYKRVFKGKGGSWFVN